MFCFLIRFSDLPFDNKILKQPVMITTEEIILRTKLSIFPSSPQFRDIVSKLNVRNPVRLAALSLTVSLQFPRRFCNWQQTKYHNKGKVYDELVLLILRTIQK